MPASVNDRLTFQTPACIITVSEKQRELSCKTRARKKRKETAKSLQIGHPDGHTVLVWRYDGRGNETKKEHAADRVCAEAREAIERK
jgi:hypothetical protein